MMGEVVSLTVHKNRRRRVEDRRASRNLISDAKTATRGKDVHGYALVAWNRDQDANVFWHWSENVPTNIMPDFVRGAILRKIGMMDNQDD